MAMDHNIAVFSAHLPLDCHPEIGNNALLAKALELKVVDTFLEYKGTNYSLLIECSITRSMVTERLKALFPKHLFINITWKRNP